MLADHYCWETKRRDVYATRPVQHDRTERRKADRFIGLWPDEMPFRNVRAYVCISWHSNIPRNNNSEFHIAVVNLARDGRLRNSQKHGQQGSAISFIFN